MAFGIEDLDSVKEDAFSLVQAFKGKAYLDLRIELFEGKGIAALQGNAKEAAEDFSITFGIRAIAKNKGLQASGYYGGMIGKDQISGIKKIFSEKASIALKRALVNAKDRALWKKKYGFFGKMVKGTELADTEAHQDTWRIKAEIDPRAVSLEELVKRTEDASKKVQEINGIMSNFISAGTGWDRKLFISSDGALIDQAKPHTSAFVYVIAKGKATESHYESIGNYYGAEVFNGKNQHEKSLEDFAEYLARGTVELSNAPAVKATGETTVVTDPLYNTLLSHEITGHPSEADRALKREAAWAGRAWWFRSIDDNEFGKQVASELVSVFSDPSMPEGYGYYKYDDEGVKAKKIYNIKNGVLNEFLNSRETALILAKEPNGGMRAQSAFDVPIIRMNNTCIEAGDWDAEEIVRDTKDGWYVFGEKIPSIGETRQNFKISCWKLFKIKNGEIGQLYRRGSVTADSYSFLKSVDAVGNDFRLYNVPNCGKGTPMQTMKVGNGGPTLRAKGKIGGAQD